MKILLTGGTGLIGQSLGQRFVKDGHSVSVLTRKPDPSRLTFKANLYSWNGELENPPREALLGVDAVIHLAGEGVADKRWTPARKKHLRQSRINSAQKLRDGLEEAGVVPQYYIGASGVGIYGDQGDRILTEDSPPGEGFLPDLCVEWEAAHRQVKARQHCLLRLGVVLTPRGGFLAKVVPMFRTLGASRLGSGGQWLSWIHIDDLVEAVMMVLNGKVSGVLNCVAPFPVTNAEMTKLLRQRIGTFPAPPVPKRLLQVLYGELSEALLESQRVQPTALERAGFQFQISDFKTALERTVLPTGTLIGRFFGNR